MADNIAGTWLVQSVQIYMLNTDNVLVLNTSLSNIGTINFIDENRNNYRNKDNPNANPIEINLSPNPGSIAYLYQYNSLNITWSIEMPKRGKAIELALSTPGNYAIYYYSTYAVTFKSDNSIELTYTASQTNDGTAFDYYDNFKEIWTLQKVN